MAQDVGVVQMCCGVIPILFGWFFRVLSLHVLVFIRKTFLWLYCILICMYMWIVIFIFRVLLDGNTSQDFQSMSRRQMQLRVLGASMEYRRTGRMRLTQACTTLVVLHVLLCVRLSWNCHLHSSASLMIVTQSCSIKIESTCYLTVRFILWSIECCWLGVSSWALQTWIPDRCC